MLINKVNEVTFFKWCERFFVLLYIGFHAEFTENTEFFLFCHSVGNKKNSAFSVNSA